MCVCASGKFIVWLCSEADAISVSSLAASMGICAELLLASSGEHESALPNLKMWRAELQNDFSVYSFFIRVLKFTFQAFNSSHLVYCKTATP